MSADHNWLSVASKLGKRRELAGVLSQDLGPTDLAFLERGASQSVKLFREATELELEKMFIF